MPFTLAHPAAVLPLRRIKYLAFIPMVIGSLTPDLVGYLPDSILDQWPSSHSKLGSVAVDLPFGLALLVVLLMFRAVVAAPLWEPHRSFVSTGFRRLLATKHWWFIAIPSTFIGVWTHLLWDSFTHQGSWGVRHFRILEIPLTPASEHHWALFHALQYASSIAGLAALAIWYGLSVRRSGLTSVDPRPHTLRRKIAIAAIGAASVAIGLVDLAFESRIESLSNYMTFAVVLTTAMLSFAILYFIAGSVILFADPSAKLEVSRVDKLR